MSKVIWRDEPGFMGAVFYTPNGESVYVLPSAASTDRTAQRRIHQLMRHQGIDCTFCPDCRPGQAP